MSSNFSKKCLKQTHRQNFQLVEDSRSTNGSLENTHAHTHTHTHTNTDTHAHTHTHLHPNTHPTKPDSCVAMDKLIPGHPE